jgi:hypothetical protein
LQVPVAPRCQGRSGSCRACSRKLGASRQRPQIAGACSTLNGSTRWYGGVAADCPILDVAVTAGSSPRLRKFIFQSGGRLERNWSQPAVYVTVRLLFMYGLRCCVRHAVHAAGTPWCRQVGGACGPHPPARTVPRSTCSSPSHRPPPYLEASQRCRDDGQGERLLRMLPLWTSVQVRLPGHCRSMSVMQAVKQ